MPKVVVNVQTYGDFDMPSTYILMYAPKGFKKYEIKSMIKIVEKDHRKTNDPEKAIQELKKLGFQPCSTVDLTIGGEL